MWGRARTDSRPINNRHPHTRCRRNSNNRPDLVLTIRRMLMHNNHLLLECILVISRCTNNRLFRKDLLEDREISCKRLRLRCS